MTDVLIVTRAEGVAELRLNRPEAGNALNTELKEALVAALREVAADEAVRAVLLSGNGKAFCVGQDLADLAATLDAEPERASETVALHYNPITQALATMEKPVVAAVHGTCVGAGLGFALACDLQVWGAGITLATAFSKVGLTCDSGLSATLPAAVGAARARELVLLGNPFTPEDGISWGLAGSVLPADEVIAAGAALAQRLAAGPTAAYAASKRLLARGVAIEATLAAEAEEQARCGATTDHQAAVSAFLAKERASFVGR
ncbi:enoyl-CoA hydratase/isomerase family protein [Nocardioides sp. Bht2]|uniref:enoyl-CoA hydratase/isomerase family protein n=1 Tax=Nocardioides sp. Bht2 TaxID=3392297 RepID=UPI0039B4AE7E